MILLIPLPNLAGWKRSDFSVTVYATNTYIYIYIYTCVYIYIYIYTPPPINVCSV